MPFDYENLSFEDKLFYGELPPRFVESLDAYGDPEVRRPTGQFLAGILENNLSAAVGHGDHEALRHMVGLHRYVFNHLPSISWGTPEKVDAWLAVPR